MTKLFYSIVLIRTSVSGSKAYRDIHHQHTSVIRHILEPHLSNHLAYPTILTRKTNKTKKTAATICKNIFYLFWVTDGIAMLIHATKSNQIGKLEYFKICVHAFQHSECFILLCNFYILRGWDKRGSTLLPSYIHSHSGPRACCVHIVQWSVLIVVEVTSQSAIFVFLTVLHSTIFVVRAALHFHVCSSNSASPPYL